MKKLLVDAMLDMTMPGRTHPLNRLGDWGTFYPCGSRWDILHCSTPELLSRRLERIKPEIPR